MLDKEIILKHLKNIENIIAVLKDAKKYSLKEIQTDVKLEWQIEHGLQLAIQNILDIGSHILSGINKNSCDTYSEVIEKLGEEKIIPQEFARRIIKMAGLRNILIHDYLEVDKNLLYDILQNRLDDFNEFLKHINEFIEKN